MGRNIDLLDFGIDTYGIKCPICKHVLSNELEELDLDCDIKSHSPNRFEIYVTCSNCDNEVRVSCIVDVEVNRE